MRSRILMAVAAIAALCVLPATAGVTPGGHAATTATSFGPFTWSRQFVS